MRCGTVFLTCAVLMLIHSSPLQVRAAGPASHCRADETIIFTCPTAGQKLVSVCASKEYGADAGHLQYRYGPAGAPELTLPPAETPPAKSAKSGTWMFSGGGGAYIQFMSGKTAYYVYSAIGRWGKQGATMEKAGVAVEKDGKIAVNIPCKGKETSELGPEFFEKAGLLEVETDFEVPE